MPPHFPSTVLIAPLDWGLGHATRCIPIIKILKDRGIHLLIAVRGPQKILLQNEFPELEFLDIPGYEIRLSGRGKKLVWGLIFRVPSILNRIRKENAWLKILCSQRKIDLIISDNRYGFYHRSIPGIFITHQLFIQSGFGRRANRILMNLNHHFIRRFSECWIPDFQNADSLAGILSHPPCLPGIPVRYAGILSRFRKEESIISNPLLIMISGPEPNRTAFENNIFRELENYQGRAVVLRGLPGNEDTFSLSNRQVSLFNHLESGPLNDLLNTSAFVICRSGYSTLMDLARLQKKAILIPTPGQPEQEYLGAWLQDKKWAITVSEKDFDLEKCMQIFHGESFGFPAFPETSLEKFMDNFFDSPLFGGVPR